MQEAQETLVQSLGREDPLEKGMATCSSILAWKFSWTEEPGLLQYMGLQKSWTWLACNMAGCFGEQSFPVSQPFLIFQLFSCCDSSLVINWNACGIPIFSAEVSNAWDEEWPQEVLSFSPRCVPGKDGEELPAEGVRWLNSQQVFTECTPQSKDRKCPGIPWVHNSISNMTNSTNVPRAFYQQYAGEKGCLS